MPAGWPACGRTHVLPRDTSRRSEAPGRREKPFNESSFVRRDTAGLKHCKYPKHPTQSQPPYDGRQRKQERCEQTGCILSGHNLEQSLTILMSLPNTADLAGQTTKQPNCQTATKQRCVILREFCVDAQQGRRNTIEIVYY